MLKTMRLRDLTFEKGGMDLEGEETNVNVLLDSGLTAWVYEYYDNSLEHQKQRTFVIKTDSVGYGGSEHIITDIQLNRNADFIITTEFTSQYVRYLVNLSQFYDTIFETVLGRYPVSAERCEKEHGWRIDHGFMYLDDNPHHVLKLVFEADRKQEY